MARNFFLIIIIFILPSITSAQRTDVIVMNNGDHITGELKKMELAMITFKTDNMGTMGIKWEKIRHIISKHFFEVDMRDGRILRGSLDTTDSRDQMLVKGEKESTSIFKEFISSIIPIKSTFWDRITGSVSLGLNYAKSTQTGQYNFGGKTNYRTKLYNLSLNLTSIVSFQDKEQSARKQDLSLDLRRFLPNKWLLASGLSFEQNTELGINLRTSLAATGGYILIHSNTNLLYGLSGLSLNRETYTDTTNASTNLEGLALVQYQIFIYDHPKTSLTTYLNVFPGLTDWGRIRGNYNIQLDWEILPHLYWDLSFYYSFDNRPSGNASSTDYGVISSFKFEINP